METGYKMATVMLREAGLNSHVEGVERNVAGTGAYEQRTRQCQNGLNSFQDID